MDADLAQVVRRELLLHDPEVRHDRARLLAFLHPDFQEYGASGRVWDRTDVATATAGSRDAITATDLNARRLAQDVVQITYRTQAGTAQALRSSTWVLTDRVWLLLFHQGTPVTVRAPGRPAPSGADRRA